jgi:soluble cytochrome b562
MLIAQQKQQENIAEYILYMYQIEDIVRAFQFDLTKIVEHTVLSLTQDEVEINAYRTWYQGIISQMKAQRIEQQGHLAEIQDIVIELSYLHNTLLTIYNDDKYKMLLDQAAGAIEEFQSKSNLKDKNNVELLLHAMYMKLLMRLKKQAISSETEEAFDSMRILLAYLVKSYHEMKNGTLSFLNN